MKFLKRIWNFRNNISKIPKIYDEISRTEFDQNSGKRKVELLSNSEIDVINKYKTKENIIEEYGARKGKVWCIRITTNNVKSGEFKWYYPSSNTFIIEIRKYEDEWYYVTMERPDINDLPASERRKVMISTGKHTSRFTDSWNKEKKYYRCDQFDSLQQLLSDMI